MKKIASVLLILILTSTFLYNVVGYYLLVSLEKEQAWVSTVQEKSDNNFRVLKLNASVYSFMEDTDFEYVNENITINKQVFHVFKKRIHDNIISLYYLPNKQQSATDISLKKLVDNDLFENAPLSKKPLEKLFKSFIKDYVPTTNNGYSEQLNNKTVILLFDDKHPNGILHSGYLSIAYSPPKTAQSLLLS
ncbi:hypothetical protein OX283_001015 [Flavobacterium sp. SUN052]|uniref:hypothetical protein n=1 Tax=Flavobacterium sp. SUN052 TaxID=3002441 RepID=UPI00237D535E|nr:hypothetical protein [Flavobacterium sp. SUN052]MEC4003222.1 hypothetical protein [Flavobacterium sp. SUN052]